MFQSKSMFLWTLGFCAALALNSQLAYAEKEAEEPGDEPTAAEIAGMPLDLADPAFDRYVNMQQVADALGNFAPETLTDAALQMAEGERILQRHHASGLTAKKLFEVALAAATKIADDDPSSNSFDRLEAGAKNWGDKELAAKIAAAKLVSGQSRGDASSEDWEAMRASAIGGDSEADDVLKKLDGASRAHIVNATYRVRTWGRSWYRVDGSVRVVLGPVSNTTTIGPLYFRKSGCTTRTVTIGPVRFTVRGCIQSNRISLRTVASVGTPFGTISKTTYDSLSIN